MVWFLGVSHLLAGALAVLCVVLWRKLSITQDDLAETKRQQVMTLHHLDRLIRHFHLRDSESPYVVEKVGEGGTISELDVRCWHCKNLRGEGHKASCPWEYVKRAVRYTENGTPQLR